MAETPDFSKLADRLKKVSKQSTSGPCSSTTRQNIMKMTMSELQNQTATFGQTHVGKTYQEMLSVPSYLSWFSARYHASQKTDHLMFLRFIQLHAEELEAQENPEKGHVKSDKVANTRPKPKAAPPASQPPIDAEIEDSEDEWAAPSSVGVSQVELMGTHNRMSEMEAVMQQILHHLNANRPAGP